MIVAEAAPAAAPGPDTAPAVASASTEGAAASAPPALPAAAVELLVGEVLVEQSAGRHRPQLGGGVAVALPLRGAAGLVVELVGTGAGERSAELAMAQVVLRPAVLVGARAARPIGPGAASPWLAVDAGVGPCLTVTLAQWTTPALGELLLVEPGLRGRAGLTLGVGTHAALRAQGGLAWRGSGVDHDYLLGGAWAW